MGLESLDTLAPELDGAARAEIAAALKQLNAERVLYSAIEERERYIRRKLSPTPLHYIIASRAVRAAMNNGQEKYEEIQSTTDVLASKLEGTSGFPK